MKRISRELLGSLLLRYPALEICAEDIQAAFEIMCASYAQGGLILTCGNGGSAADSNHIVGELMKGFFMKRPVSDEMKRKMELHGGSPEMAQILQRGIPAVSLAGSNSLLTAIGNDIGFHYIFAQQVLAFGRSENCLIGISTSGNSANIINAGIAAKALDMRTIALTGNEGGKMRSVFDVSVCAPGKDAAEIQELHLPIYHTLCAMLEAEAFQG